MPFDLVNNSLLFCMFSAIIASALNYCNFMFCLFLFVTGIKAQDDSDVQDKLSKLDIGCEISNPENSNTNPTIKTDGKTSTTPVAIVPNKAVGIVQGISSSNSTSDSATMPVRTSCYVNWDTTKHDELTKLEFVSYEQVHTSIFSTQVNTPMDLHPKRMFLIRNRIRKLNIITVDKFKRFPYEVQMYIYNQGIIPKKSFVSTFLDINLKNKDNTTIKQIFTVMDRESFFKALKNFELVFKDNCLDRFVFETVHNLQWEEIA